MPSVLWAEVCGQGERYCKTADSCSVNQLNPELLFCNLIKADYTAAINTQLLNTLNMNGINMGNTMQRQQNNNIILRNKLKDAYGKEKYIEDWSKLIQLSSEYADNHTQWVFRGEEDDHKSPLQSSLDRAFMSFKKDNEEMQLYKLETKLIREFKRKCHLYINNPPEEDRLLEWMALMQHYKAPTCLLDCTYSFLIAVYFALEYANFDSEKDSKDKSEKYCVVWAIDSSWLNEKFDCTLTGRKKMDYWGLDLAKREKIIIDYISKNREKQVLAVSPSRLNDRLTVQQGVFLCPCSKSFSFLENLVGNFSQLNSQGKIIKYKINKSERNTILKKLNCMNINKQSLFPGLDGFAESLNILPKSPILE